MTTDRTCKHVRLGGNPLAHARLTSVDGTAPEDTIDARWALCAMCASFFVEALCAATERGAVPVPLDRANTEGLV